jgi:hypothetical protein
MMAVKKFAEITFKEDIEVSGQKTQVSCSCLCEIIGVDEHVRRIRASGGYELRITERAINE